MGCGTAAKTFMTMTMQEAKGHIDQSKFEEVECLTEESMKRLAMLGRAFIAFAEEIDKKDGILKDMLVEMTMNNVIENAEEATPEEIAMMDEDDVTEGYVPNPKHIDPMFG